mgnify:CR=1 FL=1
MDQIKISAKNLGAVAMPDFCSRCFWIKLKALNKLPWQIFPGIFSSIDAYTKHCVHAMISPDVPLPEWLKKMGDVVGYEKVPHWSKLKYEDQKNGITLTGAMDDILVCRDSSRIIPDYKTAKHTDNQDKLFPMYEAQINGYALLYDPKAKLFIVYMSPVTDEETAAKNIGASGFSLSFTAEPIPLKNDKAIVERLFARTRDIYEMKQAPVGLTGCKDCESLEGIIKILK